MTKKPKSLNCQTPSGIIAPSKKKRGRRSLKDLVSRIPGNHKPREIDWGKPRGREVW